MILDDLFPDAIYTPVLSRHAIANCIESVVPKFDDKYANLWEYLKPGQNASSLIGKGYNSCYILHPNKPAPTIPKTQTGRGFATIAHWLYKRAININEVKRLGSFPDEFLLFGDYSHQWATVGNSVPPLMMKAISQQVRLFLENKKKEMTDTLIEIKDYPALLDAAWELHLAPREENAPTVISTFAGGGGSSLGYSMSGYRELLAVEWDDNAVKTFKANFPDVPVYHGDIANLSVDECLAITGLQPGELDVLDGSPPCQGFSTAGKREMTDDRNQLFREYVRLLNGLQPKVFVMENVSGMVKGKMKLIFAEILRELKDCGYQVKAKKLNAMYFGVPQSRERIIFIGIRNDLAVDPGFPKAQTKPIIVKDALENCNDGNGKQLTEIQEKLWNNTIPGNSLEFAAKKLLNKKEYFTTIKLSFSKISPTISRSVGSGILHPEKARALSLGELKRIGSFPDGYYLFGASKGQSIIGNAVPPLMMKAIASYIKLDILPIIKK